MTVKPTKSSPIAEYKETDVKLMREILLCIIEDDDIPKKERIEASKLLLRAHHALQIDKSVSATANASTKTVKLTKEDEKEIQALINA